MLHDGAVVYRGSGEILEWDEELDPVAHGQVDSVAPHADRLGSSVAGQDDERVNMQVERMIHVGVVDDLPDLDRAALSAEVDAARFEGFAVHEEPHRPTAHLLGKDDSSPFLHPARGSGRDCPLPSRYPTRASHLA